MGEGQHAVEQPVAQEKLMFEDDNHVTKPGQHNDHRRNPVDIFSNQRQPFDFADGVGQVIDPKEVDAIAAGHDKNIAANRLDKHALVENAFDPMHRRALPLRQGRRPIRQPGQASPEVAPDDDTKNNDANRLVPVVEHPLGKAPKGVGLGNACHDGGDKVLKDKAEKDQPMEKFGYGAVPFAAVLELHGTLLLRGDESIDSVSIHPFSFSFN